MLSIGRCVQPCGLFRVGRSKLQITRAMACRKIFLPGLVVLALFLVALLLKSGNKTPYSNRLTIKPLQGGRSTQSGSLHITNVFRDFFESKYPPEKRAGFNVLSTEPFPIFVLKSGVQVRTEAGWQTYSEEPRNEIWRLGPGTAKNMYVEIPEESSAKVWRAYICYSTEMKGPALFKAQAREAWQIRSFSNWNGNAWGGGRFSGEYEFFSEEFSR